MRGRGWWLAGVIGATSIVAVVVPVVPAGADGPPRCSKVGVIGGSITVGTETMQAQEFVELGITDFRIDAKVGRRITSTKSGGVVTLQRMRAAGYSPDCLVISLGTNDIPYYNQASIYRAWIVQMLDAIGPGPRVLWVNVYRGKMRVRDALFNAELDKLAAERPNLRVADWSSLAALHPTWIARDGVHPVGGGLRERAKWLAQRVQEELNGGFPADGPPAATCTIATVLLKRSTTKSPDTLCLEQRLKQLRWFTKAPNTTFDGSTASAVVAWQKRHGLPGTGIVDEATRAALGLAPAT